MTIREKIIKAVNDYVIKNGFDTWMSRKEVQEYVNSCYEEKIAPGSLLPTDYCYNRYNSGLANFAEKDRLFEYNDRQFRLLGEHYAYTGDVWHYPSDKSVKPYVVGRWENGSFQHYTNSEIEEIKVEDRFREEAPEIANNIEKELDLQGLKGEERIAATKVRVNQTVYRKGLLRRYKHCCLCGVSDDNLLVASHIKPWSDSEANEKLDFDNGLLLCPNHDKLFDLGYITFDDNGSIIISNNLNDVDKVFMNVNPEMRVTLSYKGRMYMRYHRNTVFRK
jgi:hypothetical protein